MFHGRILGGAPRPRFLVQVAAVVAILVVIVVVRPGVHRDPAPAGTTASPSTVEQSPPPEDEGGVYVPSPAGSTGTAEAVRVAAAFTAAWARPDLPAGAWWRGVAAYTEPGYAELLRSVEPANVPADRVTGAAHEVRSGAGLVVVDVPTDAGTCRVTVSDTSGTGEWKVSTHSWRPGGPG